MVSGTNLETVTIHPQNGRNYTIDIPRPRRLEE